MPFNLQGRFLRSSDKVQGCRKSYWLHISWCLKVLVEEPWKNTWHVASPSSKSCLGETIFTMLSCMVQLQIHIIKRLSTFKHHFGSFWDILQIQQQKTQHVKICTTFHPFTPLNFSTQPETKKRSCDHKKIL